MILRKIIARGVVSVSMDGRSERFGHGGLEHSDSVTPVLASLLLYQNNSTATSDCRQRTAEQSRATQPLQKSLVGHFQDSSCNETQ